jgi:hypothetical protein
MDGHSSSSISDLKDPRTQDLSFFFLAPPSHPEIASSVLLVPVAPFYSWFFPKLGLLVIAFSCPSAQTLLSRTTLSPYR